ncbi:MAG: NUDIX domain-containing protein [Sedimentisphaerales bacterium]|nr:NUDIX domain-containing protein [Sedimentisphaerales bacterium]
MRIFNCCPSCGSKDIFFDAIKKLNCRECSFTFFHNVAAAVAVILEYDRKILFTIRAKEPGKGKLDLPGGFVDPGEKAEDALKREIREELRMEIEDLEYLFSFPNIYKYKGVDYNVCDLFFYSRINTIPEDFNKGEIEEVTLINRSDIPIDKVAFESTRNCLKCFCST